MQDLEKNISWQKCREIFKLLFFKRLDWNPAVLVKHQLCVDAFRMQNTWAVQGESALCSYTSECGFILRVPFTKRFSLNGIRNAQQVKKSSGEKIFIHFSLKNQDRVWILQSYNTFKGFSGRGCWDDSGQPGIGHFLSVATITHGTFWNPQNTPLMPQWRSFH